jgi:hypothetical protein
LFAVGAGCGAKAGRGHESAFFGSNKKKKLEAIRLVAVDLLTRLHDIDLNANGSFLPKIVFCGFLGNLAATMQSPLYVPVAELIRDP